MDVEILRDHPFQNGDWRIILKRSDIYRNFVAEFVNNRETENRGCNKCEKVIKCSGNTFHETERDYRHLKIVVENATRWNSLYNCLERFLVLKPYLQVVFELPDVNWGCLKELVYFFSPFRDCDSDLQSQKAKQKSASVMVRFLNQEMVSGPFKPAIKEVWENWLARNTILYSSGPFFDYIRRKTHSGNGNNSEEHLNQ